MDAKRILCTGCLQSFTSSELVDHDGKQYCTQCHATLERRQAEFSRPEPTPATDTSESFASSIYDAIKLSCNGKLWFLRAPLILYLAYVFVMYWSDSGQYRYPDRYSGWFKPLNLGIHEAGHYLFAFLGDWFMMAGGSILQCVAPLGSMVMFYRKQDFFAIAVCFGWLATSLFDIAVYQADAVVRVLPLVSPGGGAAPRHDWLFLLHSVGLLQHCQGVALLTRLAATVMMLICVGGSLWLFWLMHKSGTSDS